MESDTDTDAATDTETEMSQDDRAEPYFHRYQWQHTELEARWKLRQQNEMQRLLELYSSPSVESGKAELMEQVRVLQARVDELQSKLIESMERERKLTTELLAQQAG